EGGAVLRWAGETNVHGLEPSEARPATSGEHAGLRTSSRSWLADWPSARPACDDRHPTWPRRGQVPSRHQSLPCLVLILGAWGVARGAPPFPPPVPASQPGGHAAEVPYDPDRVSRDAGGADELDLCHGRGVRR